MKDREQGEKGMEETTPSSLTTNTEDRHVYKPPTQFTISGMSVKL